MSHICVLQLNTQLPQLYKFGSSNVVTAGMILTLPNPQKLPENHVISFLNVNICIIKSMQLLCRHCVSFSNLPVLVVKIDFSLVLLPDCKCQIDSKDFVEVIDYPNMADRFVGLYLNMVKTKKWISMENCGGII